MFTVEITYIAFIWAFFYLISAAGNKEGASVGVSRRVSFISLSVWGRRGFGRPALIL